MAATVGRGGLTLPSMDELMDTWKPKKIVKRSASMNLLQGLSRFRHLDYISEYSTKPQDYTKPRKTSSNAGSFSKAGLPTRLASSRGVSSPTLRHQLKDRSVSVSRAHSMAASGRNLSKKKTSNASLEHSRKIRRYKQMPGGAGEGGAGAGEAPSEGRRSDAGSANSGKRREYVNPLKKVEIAVARAKQRIKDRGGYPKPGGNQQLLPFGIGKKRGSWFDQHFKVREEDDESLYRDKVLFFMRMQSKSKTNTIVQDRASWSRARAYIDPCSNRHLVPDPGTSKKDLAYFDHNQDLEILQNPADPHRLNQQTQDYHHTTAFRSTTARLLADTIDYSGPGPNMRLSNSFSIHRPNNASAAFLATTRARAHTNPIL